MHYQKHLILLIAVVASVFSVYAQEQIKWRFADNAELDNQSKLVRIDNSIEAKAASNNYLRIQEDGYISYTAEDLTSNVKIGLGKRNLSTNENEHLTFAFFIDGAIAKVMHRGNEVQSFNIASSDVLEVSKTGVFIQYKQNGNLIHEEDETGYSDDLSFNLSFSSDFDIEQRLNTNLKRIVIAEISIVDAEENCTNIPEVKIYPEGGEAPYLVKVKNHIEEQTTEFNNIGTGQEVIYNYNNYSRLTITVSDANTEEFNKVIYLGEHLEFQDNPDVSINGVLIHKTTPYNPAPEFHFLESEKVIAPQTNASITVTLPDSCSIIYPDCTKVRPISINKEELPFGNTLDWDYNCIERGFLFGLKSVEDNIKVSSQNGIPTFSNLDYGWMIQSSSFSIVEFGKIVKTYPTKPLPKDIFEITKSDNQIAFVVNGETKLTTVADQTEYKNISYFFSSKENIQSSVIPGIFVCTGCENAVAEIEDVNFNQYAIVEKKLDGSYFIIKEEQLKFKYYNKYTLNDDVFVTDLIFKKGVSCKIYDKYRNVVFQKQIKDFEAGENWYTIDLTNASIMESEFYTLELKNEKEETYKLRFKNGF